MRRSEPHPLVLGDHPVDQPVLHGLSGLKNRSRSMSGWTCSIGLAGVLGVDLVDPLADVEDLASVDLDVGRLALKPADGWWMSMRLLGSAKRLPFAPPASSSEPIDIAIPTQIVGSPA